MLDTLITRPHFCASSSAHRAAAEPGALEVGVDHWSQSDSLELLDRPADIDPGIVDQDVEPAQRVERPASTIAPTSLAPRDVGAQPPASSARSPGRSRSRPGRRLHRRRGPTAPPSAPAAASASAITRPRPRDPPVTSATSAVEPEPVQDTSAPSRLDPLRPDRIVMPRGTSAPEVCPQRRGEATEPNPNPGPARRRGRSRRT